MISINLQNCRVLVTGGAGFIGSHLVDFLMMQGSNVTVLDDLSNGIIDNLSNWIKHPNFCFVKGDCLNPKDIAKAIKNSEVVFHLAANADVRAGIINTRIDLKENVIATHNLLEEMRKNEITKTIVFTSSSTVYGEAELIPTPENYGSIKPISLYGASKLACEAFISAYCNIFNMNGLIFRLANIIGPRIRHGVIWDFTKKLFLNHRELEVLGDGKQSKSYLFIEDCIEAFRVVLEKTKDKFEIYNVGSEDKVDVKTIARIVIDNMRLEDVNIRYKMDVEEGKGWIGDVKHMLLDVTKLKGLGWKPKHNSIKSILETSKQLLKEIG